LAFRQGQTQAEKEITLFHKLFLRVIGHFGRVNDLRLMGQYNLRTLNPLKDWRLGQKLFSRGKLRLTAPPVKGLKEFREILRRVQDREAKTP
jgi:hypothetical protein